MSDQPIPDCPKCGASGGKALWAPCIEYDCRSHDWGGTLSQSRECKDRVIAWQVKEIERLLAESQADFNAAEDQLAQQAAEIEQLKATISELQCTSVTPTAQRAEE